MLWKWCHFQTHFSVLKYERWKLGFSRRVQMHFPVSCYCFSSPFCLFFLFFEHTKVTFKKMRKYSIGKDFLCSSLERWRNEIFLSHMRYFFIVSSWRENTRRWYAVYFASSATWKCIFPKRSIFLYIFSSLISTFQTVFLFFHFSSKTLPFVFAAFKTKRKKWKMKFPIHKIHVIRHVNMNIMLFFFLKFLFQRFVSSLCKIIFFSQQSHEMLENTILQQKSH